MSKKKLQLFSKKKKRMTKNNKKHDQTLEPSTSAPSTRKFPTGTGKIINI